MKKILAAAVAIGVVGLTQATLTVGSLDVSATVASACVLTNATNSLTFTTTFNPTGPAVTASGAIGITCNNGLAYTVGLDNGQNPTVGGVRRMNDGGAGRLEYTINRPLDVTNGNSNLPWGGIATANIVTRVGTGLSVDATAYGTITAGGNNATAPSGSYADTVGITISF